MALARRDVQPNLATPAFGLRDTDLDVTSEFTTKLPRRAWVVLVPAGLAVLMPTGNA
jgi:hypothetical protein